MERYASASKETPGHKNQVLAPWRLIQPGLNIEGVCHNEQCEAYAEMVAISLGYGEFDFTRIILQRENLCPICQHKIHPIKYGFKNCQWWFVNHYSMERYPLHVIHNQYKLKKLFCDYILIETMPITETSQSIICAICLADLRTSQDMVVLACSHQFHEACFDCWLHSKQLMAKACPLCRLSIEEF